MANFISDLIKGFPVTSTDPRKLLSQLVWSRELHSLVRRKMFWTQFIGKPVTGEENLETTVKGAPVVEYSEFNRNRGDRMLVPIKTHIDYDPYVTGVVGAEILTGAEKKLQYGFTSLYIDELRHATIVENVNMQTQRTALDLIKDAQDELSDWGYNAIDNNIFAAVYWGQAPVLMRSADITGGNLFTSPVAPYAHPNTFHYFDTTSHTYGNLQRVGTPAFSQIGTSGKYITTAYTLSNDRYRTVDRALIEELGSYVRAAGIPAYRTNEGIDVYIAVLHPFALAALRLNSEFFSAMQNALPRGTDNPIFTGAVGMWNGVVFHESSKIPLLPYNSIGQTNASASSVLTEFPIFSTSNTFLRLETANYKDDGSGNAVALTYYNDSDHSSLALYDVATQTTLGQSYFVDTSTAANKQWGVTPMYILGANAIALAFAKIGNERMSSYFRFVTRETTDYEKFLGFGAATIMGARRVEWKVPDASFTNNYILNQSSLCVFVGTKVYVAPIGGFNVDLANDFGAPTEAIS